MRADTLGPTRLLKSSDCKAIWMAGIAATSAEANAPLNHRLSSMLFLLTVLQPH
jgi:hypothetical protein